MKYVVKFISVVVMPIAVVYTFFINGEISQYGFWLWTLAVVVSLLTLANIASLVLALNAEDKQDEKGMLIVSSFLGFLVYSGIFFFHSKSRASGLDIFGLLLFSLFDF